MKAPFKPGDIIACDSCGSAMMRRVVGMNNRGYVVENLHGNKRHILPTKTAAACWTKVGHEL